MPDTDIETERQVRRLEEQFKRLSITDSEGDLESGFVISRFPAEAIGACCLGSDCQLLSGRDCANIGGIYHGDQSPCDPNPCGGCVALTDFVFNGVTPCCMSSLGAGYSIIGIFDGDYGSLPCTADNQWNSSGPFTGFKWTNTDCSGDNVLFDIESTFQLSFTGGIWSLNFYFIIDGVHFPIFVASSASTTLFNTITDCGGGSNGGFGGMATITP